MSLTHLMTAHAHPNQASDTADRSAAHWSVFAQSVGIKADSTQSDSRMEIAKHLTPEIVQTHGAKVWELINDANSQITSILADVLANKTFDEIPFIDNMRKKISVTNTQSGPTPHNAL